MIRSLSFVLSIVVLLARPAAALDDGLPPPWQSTDVGSVGMTGDATYAAGVFSMQGAGADIWGTADAFRFVYQSFTGDATLVARVTGETGAQPFAKAGIMFRDGLDPAASHVLLSMKPSGELEFMARFAPGEGTVYLGGAMPAVPVWLKLVKTGRTFTAYQSADGAQWGTILSINLQAADAGMIAGLVVSSHDVSALNTAAFDNVTLSTPLSPQNLLRDPGFEQQTPPVLNNGWVADAFRQTPAKSETNQPRTGAQNGACWSPDYLDCGLSQDLVAPRTGTYILQMYATADRPGGLIGANVNGATAAVAEVEPRGFGDYDAVYTLSFPASAGDTIRVWMYSPATPGYVVVDDVSLAFDEVVTVTQGTWAIEPFASGPPLGRFTLHGDGFDVNGSYDSGTVDAAHACSSGCRAGDQVSLVSTFQNGQPLTIASAARGSATVNGTSYPFVEFSGAVTLAGGTVTLPAPVGTDFPVNVTVSAPFAFSGDLKGFEVLGLRDPKLAFDVPVSGRGTSTLEMLAGPTGTMTFFRLTYRFESFAVGSR